MVRLKGLERQQKRVFIGNFNSTMVRLKAKDKDSNRLLHNVFQFHYGTIKSTLETGETTKKGRISIPLWYD